MAICKIEKFSQEEIIEIISSSKNASEALQRFGYKKTNNAPLIRRYAEKYDIDISHYPVKGKIEDLSNQIFGQLRVIKLNKEKTEAMKKTYWTCLCSCGNYHDVWAADLKRGTVKSCGCLKLKGRVKDLSNQIFDNIQVLDLNEEFSGKGNSVYWNVICLKCGKKGILRGDTVQFRKSFNCNCPKYSKNESLISNFLKEKGIHFISQFSFDDLTGDYNRLYFDFKIKDFLVEYQGEQHFKAVEYFGGIEKFKKRRKYDQKKKDYCKSHNIHLYEITYKDDTIEKLKEILKKEQILK